jgi:glucosylceramidase
MILATGGESTWGWHQNSLITVDSQTNALIFNPEYFVMKHFSKFIKTGAKKNRFTDSINSILLEA